MEVELAAVVQHQGDEEGHRLRGRPDVGDGVALPEPGLLGVGPAAPDVDDRLAVQEDGDRGTEVGPRIELVGERRRAPSRNAGSQVPCTSAMGTPFSCGRTVRGARGASSRRAQPIDPAAAAPVRRRQGVSTPAAAVGNVAPCSLQTPSWWVRGRTGSPPPLTLARAGLGVERLRGCADDRGRDTHRGPDPRRLPPRRLLRRAPGVGRLALLPLARPARSRRRAAPTRRGLRASPRGRAGGGPVPGRRRDGLAPRRGRGGLPRPGRAVGGLARSHRPLRAGPDAQRPARPAGPGPLRAGGTPSVQRRRAASAPTRPGRCWPARRRTPWSR